jgi:predicted small lipoprotein YifL
MKRFLTLAALVLLAACGADGEPQPPAASPNAAGVTISGDAQIGIVSR